MKTSDNGDYDPQKLISHERDLLNMVNIRAEMRDAITQAAKRFENPRVFVVDTGYSVQIIIAEAAADPHFEAEVCDANG